MAPDPRVAALVVRCSCGQVYQADPAHAGKSLRCRCGRTVAIKAPRPGGAARMARAREAIRRRLTALDRRRPASPIMRLLPWAYLALALLAWAVLWGLGDVWWPATVALFGPRWVLLLPLILLLPLALIRRTPFIPLLAATAIILGPVMGLRLGARNWLGAPARTLRIVTFNVDGGAWLGLDALERMQPDLIALEECDTELAERLRHAPGWHEATRSNLCFLSRWPIVAVDSLVPWNLGQRGFSGIGAAYTVRLPDQEIHVVNLHLDTPQKGLAPLRSGAGLGALEISTEIRDIGSNRTHNWVRGIHGPLLIAGDFNMPVESRIFRRYWGDYTDAFSEAGVGFGGSRVLPQFRVRIDHVLMGPGWRAVRAFVGPDLGSDHLPVVADLAWTGP